MHWFDCDDKGEQNGRECMAKQNAHHVFRLQKGSGGGPLSLLWRGDLSDIDLLLALTLEAGIVSL